MNFRWRVGPWQNCTRDCGGGVSWRIVTCVRTFEDGTQQWVRGNFCNSLRPSSRKSCNGHICPTWYAGEWSVVNIYWILFYTSALYYLFSSGLTICILETPKRVFLQTVGTQMKCSILLHFFRVSTVC